MREESEYECVKRLKDIELWMNMKGMLRVFIEEKRKAAEALASSPLEKDETPPVLKSRSSAPIEPLATSEQSRLHEGDLSDGEIREGSARLCC